MPDAQKRLLEALLKTGKPVVMVLFTGRPLKEGKWFEKFRSNYLDVSNEPLYPFGFGLSCTNFTYSPLKLSAASITATGNITAIVTVTNSGSVKGKEVVQLYLQDVIGTSTRAVKELKGFQKIELNAGESKTVTFTISVNDLKYYNADMKYVAEPGEFKVMIGGNSRDVQSASFILQ